MCGLGYPATVSVAGVGAPAVWIPPPAYPGKARRHRVEPQKIDRLYKEKKLTVRIRGGRKRALGTRASKIIPQGPNQCWSHDFTSDALIDGRSFRILV